VSEGVGESPASAVGIGDGVFRQRLASQLKAGFSRSAVSVRPGRDREPVVWSATSEDAVGQGLPRHEMRKDSSLFFIVWSFLSTLDLWKQYYDRC